MRRLVLLALLCAAPASAAAAQSTVVPDTVAAWRYAPLGIGDEWAYEYFGRIAIRIEGDTLIDGLRYVRQVTRQPTNGSAPQVLTVAFLRFDTVAAVVVAAPGTSPRYLRGLRERFLERRFDTPLSSSAEAPGPSLRYGVFARVEDWTFRDHYSAPPTSTHRLRTKSIVFWTPDLPGHATYGTDVGLLSYDDGAADAHVSVRLSYARVGGKTYGVRPLWVGASAAAQSAAQEVRAFPQPFAGRLQIEAPHIERGEAVLADLLGRRVARAPVEAGRAEIDGSGLAPGVYALRVCADGGGVCTVRAVVRR